VETKICNICGVEKPINDFSFRKDSGKYRLSCKECIKEKRKDYLIEYRKNNKEKFRQYYLENSNPSYRLTDFKYPDKYCKHCGELISKKRGKEYDTKIFCNQKCHHEYYRLKNTKICEICGKKYISYQKNSKYCSQDCANLRRSLENEYIPCDNCGKLVEVRKSRKRDRKNFFCNSKCHRQYEKENYTPRVKKINKICKICGKQFEVYPSYEKQSKDNGYEILYCSIECRNNDKERMTEKASNMNKIQSNKKGLNLIETIMEKILNDLKLDFKSQHLMFDKFLVDFYLPNYNLVIQCDGDYWHGHPSKLKEGKPDKRQDKRMKLDKSQDAYMKKCGVNILRFWEHKIKKSEEEISDTIKRTISEIA